MSSTRTRIRQGHPYHTTRADRQAGEVIRYTVTDEDGTILGDVVNVRRKLDVGGSEYGWRPADAGPRARLDNLLDAAARLAR